MALQRQSWLMAGAVIAVQVVDAGLHIAIKEVETLRILSNVVLAAAVALGVVAATSWRAAILGGAGAYVVLNLVFVAVYGLENPVSGVNRTPLFAFMALSLWLAYRVERLQSKARSATPA